MAGSTQLKSDALLEQMKQHLNTDAGKALVKKLGLVYQINVAPKVTLISCSFNFLFPVLPDPSNIIIIMINFYFCIFHKLQKMGFDEVTYIVDLKKGEVTKGFDFDSSFAFCFWFPILLIHSVLGT